MESSVIDVFIICETIREYLIKMKVHDDGRNKLVNFVQKEKGKAAKESDHNLLEMDLDLKFCKIKPDRTSHFNFKEEGSL